MKATAILRHLFIWSLYKLGIGIINMIRSCRIAFALFAKPIAPTSRHVPFMSRSQNDFIGVHAKMVKNWMIKEDTMM